MRFPVYQLYPNKVVIKKKKKDLNQRKAMLCSRTVRFNTININSLPNWSWFNTNLINILWETSLVAQWLRICLPMQGTQVWSLVREDPTCHGATNPVRHNYWTCVPHLLKPARFRACARQQETLPQWEARAPQRRVGPTRRNWREPTCSNKDPMQLKKKNKKKPQNRS